MVPYPSIPSYYRWVYWADMMRYPLQFFIANEMRGQAFHCGDPDGGTASAAPYGTVGAIPIFVGGRNASSPPPPFGLGEYREPCGVGHFPHVDVLQNTTNPHCWRWYCPVTSGEAILEMFSVPSTNEGMVREILAMVAFLAVFRLLSVLSLKFVQHIKR